MDLPHLKAIDSDSAEPANPEKTQALELSVAYDGWFCIGGVWYIACCPRHHPTRNDDRRLLQPAAPVRIWSRDNCKRRFASIAIRIVARAGLLIFGPLWAQLGVRLSSKQRLVLVEYWP
jgi:hypothetical protein